MKSQLGRWAVAAALLGAGRSPAPFAVGETLRYDARIGVVGAGVATTTVARADVIRGQPVYVFTMTGSGGLPALRTEYRMTSWTGMAPFTSRRFERHASVAGRVEDHRFEIVADSLRYREEGVAGDWITPPAPLDELAFLYYLRTLPLAVGDSRALRGYFRNGYNPVMLRVTGRETVALGDGTTAACLVLHLVSAGTTMDLWLTDDARRLPARLDLPSSFGRVRLTLRGRGQ